MTTQPVEDTDGLVHFTQHTLVYAGRHRHETGYAAHTHSFLEVAVVVGGEGTHDSLAGPRRLSRGDVVLIRPGAWHGYRDCVDLELFNCCFDPQMLRRELAWAREDPLLGHLLWTGPYAPRQRGMLAAHLDRTTFGECVSHLESLAALRSRTLALYRGDVVGRLAMFLSGLARAAVGPTISVAEAAGPVHPAVTRAMSLLDDRLAHAWTLGELAGELHLAPGSLVRLFTSAVGMPPMAYLARQRAEAAAAQLLATDRPITEIGRSVGWADPNYFARRFRTHFGLNATEYRRRFRSTSAATNAWFHDPESEAESVPVNGTAPGSSN